MPTTPMLHSENKEFLSDDEHSVERSLEHEKLACFWGKKRCGGIDWYALDASWDEEEDKNGSGKTESVCESIEIRVHPFSKEKVNPNCTCIALGSTIYCLGADPGTDEFSSRVLIYDTKCPLDGWKEGPPMNSCRMAPHASVIDGKIYVLGGIFPVEEGSARQKFLPEEPWMEFLDPSTQTWEAIKPLKPPPITWSRPVSAFVYCQTTKRKEILVDSRQNLEDGSGGRGRVLRFLVDDGSWETFDDECLENHIDCCPGQALVVDRTLYWFGSKLMAYDLDEKIWFTVPVGGLKQLGKRSKEFQPRLFHFNDNIFCLLWLGEGSYSYKYPLLSRMHCTKLRVSRSSSCEGQGSLDAYVVSSKCYLFDVGMILQDGFLVERGLDVEKDLKTAPEMHPKKLSTRQHQKKRELLVFLPIALISTLAIVVVNMYRRSG